jgi:hypothetical protein
MILFFEKKSGKEDFRMESLKGHKKTPPFGKKWSV